MIFNQLLLNLYVFSGKALFWDGMHWLWHTGTFFSRCSLDDCIFVYKDWWKLMELW